MTQFDKVDFQPRLPILKLFEGKVTEVQRLETNKWAIVRVRGKQKPLGIDMTGFTGTLPARGDRISVQAREGERWFFAEHRTIVIDHDPQPHADYITAPDSLMRELEQYVLSELDSTGQVSSDDVHDGIMERVGEGHYSPKIVGMVFGSLARKRKIHKVGRIKTRRPAAHAREIVVWERTRK